MTAETSEFVRYLTEAVPEVAVIVDDHTRSYE
jgi:hypothetical protein